MRLALVLLASCALATKAQPREVRYFAPPRAVVVASDAPPCARVRLGRITASDTLRRPIVRRVSQVEVAPYETLRWTDFPEVYVRRAVVDALTATPLELAVAGDALVLDVELLAFEDTGHGGRVALRYAIRNDRQVVTRGQIEEQQPAHEPAIEPTIAAIGAALGVASDRLAHSVIAAACR